MLISGKRGSGKSYDLGVIAESLTASDSDVAFGMEQFALILFDTQNQFWTLSAANDASSEINEWGLSGGEIPPPMIYTPRGVKKQNDFELEFAIRPRDLNSDDWTNLCDVDRFSATGQCLRTARAAMTGDFDIEDMVDWLESDDADSLFGEASRDAVRWRLLAQSESSLFDSSADDLGERRVSAGEKSIIQLADLPNDLQAVVVAVTMRKIMSISGPEQRKRKMAAIKGSEISGPSTVAPRIWCIIDEAQVVCPAARSTAATPVIIDYVKRGRDAGLSLVMATQQPSALNSEVISQCDIAIVHKLTVDPDIRAATERMPSMAPRNVSKGGSKTKVTDMDGIARSLEAGVSLVADAESNRSFLAQTRPRISPHGGGEPEL